MLSAPFAQRQDPETSRLGVWLGARNPGAQKSIVTTATPPSASCDARTEHRARDVSV